MPRRSPSCGKASRGIDRIVHLLGGDIRCADYAAPGTEAVGTNAIPALKDRGGCTLANHGVLAVGKDLAQAYLRAEYIEDVAKVYTFSKVLGTPVELASL